LQGTTIVLTSHDMDDIEALCSRVMIIDHGRIGYDGGLTDLVRSARPRKLVNATYAEPVPPELVADLADADLEVLEVTDQVLRLAVDRERTSDALQRLTRLGPLVDLDVTDTDINEIIRDLFSQQRPFAMGGGAWQ
jgi:ABC-2 type transport system ATP-binding protein